MGAGAEPQAVTMKTEVKRLIPLHDYAHAVQSAVSWLGDRYLLADPVPRRSEDRKPGYKDSRRWQASGHL